MSRPNILWICSDQQRYDTLGCYGNEFVRTPNLDGLAKGGVRFDHAYTQSPVCTPSRAAFLTGRYPRTTRCRQNGQTIPPDEVLVTRMLADAGYACGLSGKLHLAPCNPEVAPDHERRVNDGYTDFHWSHHPSPDWSANEYSVWLEERGQAYRPTPVDGCDHVVAGMPAEFSQTAWCAEKAVEFMKARARDSQPWLFSVNMFDPHHPFDPAEYLERYLAELDSLPLPDYSPGELDDKSAWQQRDHEGAYGGRSGFRYDDMSERDHRLVRAAYWAMCDLIDDQVGRMLRALDETGQLDSTIVIYMSDHGEMLGDHGIYLKGPHFYEPAVRVPLIVSWPGTIAGERASDALVELVDIAPTLLDAAGLPPSDRMQGKSLWPTLRGEVPTDQHRNNVYSEYYNAMPFHAGPTAQATMIRSVRYKLIAAHSVGGGELYDLESDPGESRNRWSDTDYAEAKSEMLERLVNRMAWTVDPWPPRTAPW